MITVQVNNIQELEQMLVFEDVETGKKFSIKLVEDNKPQRDHEPFYINQSNVKKIYGIGQDKLNSLLTNRELSDPMRNGNQLYYKTSELKELEEKGKIVKKRLLA